MKYVIKYKSKTRAPTLRKIRILRQIVPSMKTGMRNWKIAEKAVYLRIQNYQSKYLNFEKYNSLSFKVKSRIAFPLSFTQSCSRFGGSIIPSIQQKIDDIRFYIYGFGTDGSPFLRKEKLFQAIPSYSKIQSFMQE